MRPNNLFSGTLPTFPENFMQIVLPFLRKIANRQTNKQRRLHILLGGGNYGLKISMHLEGRPLLITSSDCWNYLRRTPTIFIPSVNMVIICQKPDSRLFG